MLVYRGLHGHRPNLGGVIWTFFYKISQNSASLTCTNLIAAY